MMIAKSIGGIGTAWRRAAMAAAAVLAAATCAAVALAVPQVALAQTAPARAQITDVWVDNMDIEVHVSKAKRAQGYRYEVEAAGYGTRTFDVKGQKTDRARMLQEQSWWDWSIWRMIADSCVDGKVPKRLLAHPGEMKVGKPFPMRIRARAWTDAGGKRKYGRWSKTLRLDNWTEGTNDRYRYEHWAEIYRGVKKMLNDNQKLYEEYKAKGWETDTIPTYDYYKSVGTFPNSGIWEIDFFS